MLFGVAVKRVKKLLEKWYRPTLWVHGRIVKTTRAGSIWDFLGIHATQKEAANLCRDASEFIFPATVGVEFDRTWLNIPGVEFPMQVERRSH